MIRTVTNRLIGNEKPSEIQNFIWNMMGSLMVSLSSMLLSLFVIRLIGPEDGGVFAIALTLSQMLMYIAYFEMRTFQVTDAKKKYLFGEYHTAKIFLCIVMLLVSFAYVSIRQYSFEKSLVVLLVCLWKDFDGYADVYESQFQTEERLDLAGKSMMFRTLFSLVMFFLALMISKSLIISLVVANIIAILGVFLFDMAVMKEMDRISISFKIRKIRYLLMECMPLFIGIFCWVYILSASRIAIDNNMSSVYQSYYQILFLPVSVINLFAGFIFKPLLPKLAMFYEKGENNKFYGIIGKGIICLGGITVICVLGAYLLGVPVLSFLSGCDLKPYKNILIFLIFAGGINAIDLTLYYVLTILRAADAILADYIIAAITAFLISNPMVKAFGIKGAAGSYFIVNIVMCIMFSISIMRKNRIRDKVYRK